MWPQWRRTEASRRFTQEDPIGLAGGLNLYGFASGDPVNFSDPFGLCPIFTRVFGGGCKKWRERQLARAVEILQQEQQAGNPDALAVDPATVTPMTPSAIRESCKNPDGKTSNTGCWNATEGIRVNVHRNAAAISATLVHEQQHANNPSAPQGSEACAQRRTGQYVENMLPTNRTKALSGHFPSYTTTSNPNYQGGLCAGL